MKDRLWMDSLIAVNKSYEKSYKQQCVFFVGEIQKLHESITLLTDSSNLLKSRLLETVDPVSLYQSHNQITRILNEIECCHEKIDEYEEKLKELRKMLRESAQKRILLEGLKERKQKQLQQELGQKEEELLAELSRKVV